MKKLFTALVLVASTQIADASVTWDWFFPTDNIALSPTETFYLGGTITNDLLSGESLDIGAYSWWISDGDMVADDFLGGLYNYHNTANESGGLLANNSSAIIAPGESLVFTIAHFEPIQAITAGTQFSWTVVLFNNYNDPTESSITRTINVTVVPIPPAILLSLSGLFCLLAMKKTDLA